MTATSVNDPRPITEDELRRMLRRAVRQAFQRGRARGREEGRGEVLALLELARQGVGR